MTIRKIVLWLHIIMGVSAGVIILIMSVTGMLLAYEKQITSWMDSNLRSQPAPSAVQRLPIQTLLSAVRDATGARPVTLTLYADSAAAAIVTSGPTVYINVYNGAIIGTGSARTRAFFRKVTEWHRYITLSGDSRKIGKAMTGAANLMFLCMVLSGVYLWWRGAITFFRRGLSGKALHWNWHNVFGVWASLPLFLVVLSATVISYPWASNMVYRITGSDVPKPAEGRGQERNRNSEPLTDVELSDVDFVVAHAGIQIPDWKTMSLRLPSSRDGSLSLEVDRGNSGQPQLRSTLTVDRQSGKKIRAKSFADQSPGRRVRSWLRFVHTGEYYGLAGQTVACIASIAAVMLVWTGFALFFDRFSVWRRKGSLVPSIQSNRNLSERHPPQLR